jgi:hypothetical protein
MKKIKLLLRVWMVGFCGLMMSQAHAQKITAVNYSDYPIFATGITLTQEQVGQTPVRFKRSDV